MGVFLVFAKVHYQTKTSGFRIWSLRVMLSLNSADFFGIRGLACWIETNHLQRKEFLHVCPMGGHIEMTRIRPGRLVQIEC